MPNSAHAFARLRLHRLRSTLRHAPLVFVPVILSAQDLSAQVRTEKGAPLADAVVVATPEGALPKPPAAPGEEVVDQIDKEFEPYVKVVLVGSAVRFPNKDNVRHQVYSFSPAKRFNLPLYAGTPAQPVIFDKPGVVTLGCNIHDWMLGFIYVSASPYFAKTDQAGVATLPGLPEGKYALRVWHPLQKGGESDTLRYVEVGRAAQMEITWQVAVKQDIRPRRSAAGEGVVY